jgi:hypothetical protein
MAGFGPGDIVHLKQACADFATIRGSGDPSYGIFAREIVARTPHSKPGTHTGL